MPPNPTTLSAQRPTESTTSLPFAHSQVRRIPTASEILVLRGFVQQLCAALNRINLWTVPLEAAMHEAQGRYLDLLVREGVAAAQAVVDKERYEPLVLASRREYESEVVAAGLHAEGAPLPAAFPVTMSYSRSVAGLLRVLGSFCSDCVEFNAHAKQRDLDEEVRLVVRQSHVLAERMVRDALLPVVDGRRLKPDQAMQLVANAIALADAIPGLYSKCANHSAGNCSLPAFLVVRSGLTCPVPRGSLALSLLRRCPEGSGRCASSRPPSSSASPSSSPRRPHPPGVRFFPGPSTAAEIFSEQCYRKL